MGSLITEESPVLRRWLTGVRLGATLVDFPILPHVSQEAFFIPYIGGEGFIRLVGASSPRSLASVTWDELMRESGWSAGQKYMTVGGFELDYPYSLRPQALGVISDETWAALGAYLKQRDGRKLASEELARLGELSPAEMRRIQEFAMLVDCEP